MASLSKMVAIPCWVCAKVCYALGFDVLCSFCGLYAHARCAGLDEDVAMITCQFACPDCTDQGKASSCVAAPSNSTVQSWRTASDSLSFATITKREKSSQDFLSFLQSPSWPYSNVAVRHVDPQDLTSAMMQANGFRDPIHVTKTIPGAVMPPGNIFPHDIPSFLGSWTVAKTIEPSTLEFQPCSVIDIETHCRDAAFDAPWNWNVEFPIAATSLENQVQAPPIVQEIDWFHQLNPTCLLNPNTFLSIYGADTFRDARISPCGSSSWLYVASGLPLNVFLIPPSATNMATFARWRLADGSVHQSVFLPDAVDACLRLELLPHQTLFLPPGWIYALYVAPQAGTCVFLSGYFLHGFSLHSQFQAHALENTLASPLDWPFVSAPIEFSTPQRATGTLAQFLKYWIWPAMHMYWRRLKKQRLMSPWENWGLFLALPSLRALASTAEIDPPEEELACGWFAGITSDRIEPMLGALTNLLEITTTKLAKPFDEVQQLDIAQPDEKLALKEETPSQALPSTPTTASSATATAEAPPENFTEITAPEDKSESRLVDKDVANERNEPQATVDDVHLAAEMSFLKPVLKCSCDGDRCLACGNCKAGHCLCPAPPRAPTASSKSSRRKTTPKSCPICWQPVCICSQPKSPTRKPNQAKKAVASGHKSKENKDSMVRKNSRSSPAKSPSKSTDTSDSVDWFQTTPPMKLPTSKPPLNPKPVESSGGPRGPRKQPRHVPPAMAASSPSTSSASSSSSKASPMDCVDLTSDSPPKKAQKKQKSMDDWFTTTPYRCACNDLRRCLECDNCLITHCTCPPSCRCSFQRKCTTCGLCVDRHCHCAISSVALSAEAQEENQERFIRAIWNDQIAINDRLPRAVIADLSQHGFQTHGYDSLLASFHHIDSFSHVEGPLTICYRCQFRG
ncbi:hypothetical protein LEN26_019508 [Aphanomyces euteiches]|nr:hypothetical protein LEN26_019508 [Aphanomyces euteiches]KAH9184406.1 hypothetical protein AeNC1_013615 [Aphanomyces euteiches]